MPAQAENRLLSGQPQHQ
jgi:hypothetical protein